jgi:hypothetical protein
MLKVQIEGHLVLIVKFIKYNSIRQEAPNQHYRRFLLRPSQQHCCAK